MKLSIIVPCYNEVENIPNLKNELLPIIETIVARGYADNSEQCQAEIVFVDDGSQDGTMSKLKEVFENYNQPGIKLKYVQHQTNLGLGAALRTGFSAADGDILITVDSDGTYKFSEIPALLDCLVPGIDIVTASPYNPAGGVVGVPANRLVLSKGSSMIYRILLDWHIYTYTSLFRAYRSEVIRNISFDSNGFLGGTELMVKAMLKGYRVAEYPSVLFKRVYGVSKAKIWQTIIAHLKFQTWVLFYRLRSGLRGKPERSSGD
jgi:dolichol-phosphate mannosyltransferase